MMKVLITGFVLIVIALYLVVLYSVMVVAARSDETMKKLMDEWMERNDAQNVRKAISEEKE